MKDYAVGIRISTEERERLTKIADKAGLTLSEMIRLVLSNVVSVSRPSIKWSARVEG